MVNYCQNTEKNYLFKSIQIDFEDRKFGEAKGGGSLFGKIKLSIQVFKYLIFDASLKSL